MVGWVFVVVFMCLFFLGQEPFSLLSTDSPDEMGPCSVCACECVHVCAFFPCLFLFVGWDVVVCVDLRASTRRTSFGK